VFAAHTQEAFLQPATLQVGIEPFLTRSLQGSEHWYRLMFPCGSKRDATANPAVAKCRSTFDVTTEPPLGISWADRRSHW
jgi:hypothetical protein